MSEYSQREFKTAWLEFIRSLSEDGWDFEEILALDAEPLLENATPEERIWARDQMLEAFGAIVQQGHEAGALKGLDLLVDASLEPFFAGRLEYHIAQPMEVLDEEALHEAVNALHTLGTSILKDIVGFTSIATERSRWIAGRYLVRRRGAGPSFTSFRAAAQQWIEEITHNSPFALATLNDSVAPSLEDASEEDRAWLRGQLISVYEADPDGAGFDMLWLISMLGDPGLIPWLKGLLEQELAAGSTFLVEDLVACLETCGVTIPNDDRFAPNAIGHARSDLSLLRLGMSYVRSLTPASNDAQFDA